MAQGGYGSCQGGRAWFQADVGSALLTRAQKRGAQGWTASVYKAFHPVIMTASSQSWQAARAELFSALQMEELRLRERRRFAPCTTSACSVWEAGCGSEGEKLASDGGLLPAR